MDKKLTAGLSAAVAVLLATVVALALKQPVVVTNTLEKLGATPGSEVSTEHFTVNGVEKHFFSSALNQASTTICSFRTPNATSTLLAASVKLTTGTTTAIALELGKGTQLNSTTTRISLASVGSANQVTLTAAVASTTAAYGALGQQHTADEQDLVFAPRTYLNAKIGGVLGSTNVLVGSCKAEFLVN